MIDKNKEIVQSITLEKLIPFLKDYGIIKHKGIDQNGLLKLLPHKKPTHGSCCTCQKCGYYHDDCVCEHNEFVKLVVGAKD